MKLINSAYFVICATAVSTLALQPPSDNGIDDPTSGTGGSLKVNSPPFDFGSPIVKSDWQLPSSSSTDEDPQGEQAPHTDPKIVKHLKGNLGSSKKYGDTGSLIGTTLATFLATNNVFAPWFALFDERVQILQKAHPSSDTMFLKELIKELGFSFKQYTKLIRIAFQNAVQGARRDMQSTRWYLTQIINTVKFVKDALLEYISMVTSSLKSKTKHAKNIILSLKELEEKLSEFIDGIQKSNSIMINALDSSRSSVSIGQRLRSFLSRYTGLSKKTTK
ncbi:hypothetical protein BSLG_008030 [Batrachochytrium salamandrivorans]|nr:hypothetical protein BSLG_008030 [Batrachochytrium salamandrivorans]